MYLKSQLLNKIYSKTNQSRDQFIEQFKKNEIVQSIPQEDRNYFLARSYSLIHSFNIYTEKAKKSAIQKFYTDFYQKFKDKSSFSSGLNSLNSNRMKRFYIESLIKYDNVDDQSKVEFLESEKDKLTGNTKEKVNNYLKKTKPLAVESEDYDFGPDDEILVPELKDYDFGPDDEPATIESEDYDFGPDDEPATIESEDYDFGPDDELPTTRQNLTLSDFNVAVKKLESSGFIAEKDPTKRLTVLSLIDSDEKKEKLLNDFKQGISIDSWIYKSLRSYIINKNLGQLATKLGDPEKLSDRLISNFISSINSAEEIPAFLTVTRSITGKLIENTDLTQEKDSTKLKQKLKNELKNRFKSPEKLLRKILLTGSEQDKLEQSENLSNIVNDSNLDKLVSDRVTQLKQESPNAIQKEKLINLQKSLKKPADWVPESKRKTYDKYNLPYESKSPEDYYKSLFEHKESYIVDSIKNNFKENKTIDSVKVNSIFEKIKQIFPGRDITSDHIMQDSQLVNQIRSLGPLNVGELVKRFVQLRNTATPDVPTFHNWWQELINYVEQNKSNSKDALRKEVKSRVEKKIKSWKRSVDGEKIPLTSLEDIERMTSYIMDLGIGTTLWRGEDRTVRVQDPNKKRKKYNNGNGRKRSKKRIDEGKSHNMTKKERKERSDKGTHGRTYKKGRKSREI